MDVPEGRVKIAFARGKCSFAFGTLEDSDQMCRFAIVAKYFGNSASVVIPLHVRFVGAVVGSFAWWFAPDLERGGLVRCGGRIAQESSG